jgi:hypothetical protein
MVRALRHLPEVERYRSDFKLRNAQAVALFGVGAIG